MSFRSFDFRLFALLTILVPGVCGTEQSYAQDAPSATATAGSAAPKLTKELDIPGDKPWTDTGIDVTVGERLAVESDGQVKYQSGFASPQGMKRSWSDLTRSLPVNSAGTGSVIGRIGSDDAAIPFAIGQKKEVSVRRAGRLFWD